MLRKTSYILAVIFIQLVINNSVSAKTLNAGIVIDKELPYALYGTWRVESERIETNNPYLFKADSIDIWNFSKQNGYVTLSNPQNNASSTIHVNEVKNNIATFSRQKNEDKYIEKEVCHIKLDDDTFYGTDTLVFESYNAGQLILVNSVEYKIIGKKIKGSKLNNLFAK
ncbi:MAG: hypothetical protein WCK67_05960 [bacterium]